MTNLFLDTEWADAEGSELVSLALVSEDGLHVFYAERDPLPDTKPTDFVCYVVYPLLERGVAALSDAAMTTALRRFLANVPAPCVLADYQNDFNLLRHALAGFELPDVEAAACGPIPTVEARLLRGGLTWMVLEDWFEAHPDQAKRRHHALVDAQALRMACLAATRQVEAPWSPTLALGRASP